MNVLVCDEALFFEVNGPGPMRGYAVALTTGDERRICRFQVFDRSQEGTASVSMSPSPACCAELPTIFDRRHWNARPVRNNNSVENTEISILGSLESTKLRRVCDTLGGISEKTCTPTRSGTPKPSTWSVTASISGGCSRSSDTRH